MLQDAQRLVLGSYWSGSLRDRCGIVVGSEANGREMRCIEFQSIRLKMDETHRVETTWRSADGNSARSRDLPLYRETPPRTCHVTR